MKEMNGELEIDYRELEDYDKISSLAHKKHAPIFITKDDKRISVIMSIPYYEEFFGKISDLELTNNPKAPIEQESL